MAPPPPPWQERSANSAGFQPALPALYLPLIPAGSRPMPLRPAAKLPMPRAPCVVSSHLRHDWLLLGPPKNVKIATISVVESGAGLTPPGRAAADPVAPVPGAIGGARLPLTMGTEKGP